MSVRQRYSDSGRYSTVNIVGMDAPVRRFKTFKFGPAEDNIRRLVAASVSQPQGSDRGNLARIRNPAPVLIHPNCLGILIRPSRWQSSTIMGEI